MLREYIGGPVIPAAVNTVAPDAPGKRREPHGSQLVIRGNVSELHTFHEALVNPVVGVAFALDDRAFSACNLQFPILKTIVSILLLFPEIPMGKQLQAFRPTL
jgi:hypothetical protein